MPQVLTCRGNKAEYDLVAEFETNDLTSISVSFLQYLPRGAFRIIKPSSDGPKIGNCHLYGQRASLALGFLYEAGLNDNAVQIPLALLPPG